MMKERPEANIGLVKKKQADAISLSCENVLGEKNALDEETSDKLRNTVLVLIDTNCGLRAVDKHYNLHRDGPTKMSQFMIFDVFDIPWILQNLLFAHTSFWQESFLNIPNQSDLQLICILAYWT